MSLSATIFGRDSFIFKATNVLGLGLPGFLDRKFGPKDTEGPRIGDLTVQTSSYGVEIGRVHGTIGIAGNLIWLENNKLKEKTHKKKSGGKGGASAEPTITYTYSATFAIGICEGPIDGIARIWCGDKLIYNAGSGDVSTIIASNKSAKGLRIHLGTDDQLPDTRYQASKGVGNTPAFRGLAYVVFDDFQLADYGNTLQAANFKFEVVQVADRENVRKLVGSELPFAFRRDGAPYQYGRPFISGVDGVIFVTNPDNNRFTFGLDGNLISYTAQGKILPDGQDFLYNSGYLGDELLIVNNVLDPFSTHAVLTPSRFQENLPQDHYLWGVCISTDGLNVLALTHNTNPFTSNDTICSFWLMDEDGDVIKSGITAQPIARTTFGYSVNSQVTTYESSSMENGAEYVWSCGGAGVGAVRLWRIVDSQLMLVKELSGGNGDYNFTKPATYAADGVAYVVSGGTVNIFTRLEQVLKTPPTVSEVIALEALTSDLISAQDIDVSALTQTVHGYAVQGGSIRSAIEPLQTAFRFDVVQSGYVAKFIPRGAASSVTIPSENLLLNNSDSASQALVEDREMDTQLPVKTTVKYLDAAREYSVSNQSFERLTTRAVGKKDIEIPIVMTATEAAQTAEILTLLPWLERSTFSFKLPPIYQALEPSDVITVITPWASIELRLGKIDYGTDGALDCTATPNKASLYTSQAVANDPPPPTETIGIPGASLFLPMDIPLISENLQSSPGFVAAMVGYTPAWTGAVLLQTDDNGQTWKGLQGFTGMSTLGVCRGLLPQSAGTLIDQRVLNVSLIDGELESVTRDQMLSGMHYVAYGVDGRWEIVRFQSASLLEDGSYAVSGFVRGEKGTEWATGLHQLNDYFVLLDDPDNIVIDLPIDALLAPKTYRAVTLGADTDSAPDVPFTYKGVNLEPLSPVYPKPSRGSDGSMTIRVQRRSRFSSSWWANGMEAPVGETSLALEADVISAGTVKRTLTSSSGVFTYSAAEQATDFGSVQSSILFRFYQLSSVVGRGYPLEVSL